MVLRLRPLGQFKWEKGVDWLPWRRKSCCRLQQFHPTHPAKVDRARPCGWHDESEKRKSVVPVWPQSTTKMVGLKPMSWNAVWVFLKLTRFAHWQQVQHTVIHASQTQLNYLLYSPHIPLLMKRMFQTEVVWLFFKNLSVPYCFCSTSKRQ